MKDFLNATELIPVRAFESLLRLVGDQLYGHECPKLRTLLHEVDQIFMNYYSKLSKSLFGSILAIAYLQSKGGVMKSIALILSLMICLNSLGMRKSFKILEL